MTNKQSGMMSAAMLIAAAMTVLADQPARAETRTFDTAGTGLAVAAACARHVTITADPALSGRISVTADADHPEEIAQIDVATAGGRARVGLRTGLRECWTPQPQSRFDRTLVLRIRVPAAFPVAISESGLGDYALGAVGRLTLSASGSIHLRADAILGDARLDLSGESEIEIAQLDAARLNIDLSGAGSLHVRDGRIGNVEVSDSGAARVQIDPVVDSARLDSSGVGSISLGGVRGTLRQASSGPGRITVAGRPSAPPPDAD